MVEIMTSKKFNALLAVSDLFGLLVLAWLSILLVPVYYILLTMVCIPLLEMMKGFNMRDKLGL